MGDHGDKTVACPFPILSLKPWLEAGTSRRPSSHGPGQDRTRRAIRMTLPVPMEGTSPILLGPFICQPKTDWNAVFSNVNTPWLVINQCRAGLHANTGAARSLCLPRNTEWEQRQWTFFWDSVTLAQAGLEFVAPGLPESPVCWDCGKHWAIVCFLRIQCALCLPTAPHTAQEVEYSELKWAQSHEGATLGPWTPAHEDGITTGQITH